MPDVNNRVETIFSHAVALDQAGRLRSTIYCMDNHVYIANQDDTVVLAFTLRSSEAPFKSPVSFRANDYDGRRFAEEDGQIVFITEGGGWERRKSCGVPDMKPDDAEMLFSFHWGKADPSCKVEIHRTILSHLEERLSHVEIASDKDGNLTITQRNVYDGTTLVLRREQAGLVDETNDELPSGLSPIGIRTNDLIALFSFAPFVALRFGQNPDCLLVESIGDNRAPFQGIVAACQYDELGTTERNQDDGRQESQAGDRKPSTGTKAPSRPGRGPRRAPARFRRG